MLIEKASVGVYTQYRIPGIVITENDTLLAYYECRRSNSDWADIDIKIIRSDDGGETWQTVTVIEGNGNTLNNPVMFVKHDEVHFLFLKNYKELFYCFSCDDGRSFSSPQKKCFELDRFYNAAAVGPGHGIVHKGKMIVPMWFASNEDNPKAHFPSSVATIYSTDGENWSLGEFIGEDLLINPSECALSVTSDNKVLISIRNENDCHKRAFAVSDTGTANWSQPYFHPQMPDPICMGSMCYEDDTVYHINCDSDTKRENLTVKKSEDCFKTFDSIFVDTPAGYSDIAVKSGCLYILYERNCNIGELHFKKICVNNT